MDEKSGLTDRIEVYNIPKFHPAFPQKYPDLIVDNLDEIKGFAKDLHSEILDPLHTLLAIALELPHDYFTNIHKYQDKSEDHLRYMKYTRYNQEETETLGNMWTPGHTDLGTLTLLFRQPVAALQIKLPKTGEWKWVKPQDNTLTVNACDALSFLTGGYIKSTIHRVASPPKDQQHVDRLGVLYFARPRNDLILNTIKESPVLQRAGYTENEMEKSGEKVPSMEEWTYAKQTWQQRKGAYNEGAPILAGVTGRLYE